jgi:hypothetical protein
MDHRLLDELSGTSAMNGVPVTGATVAELPCRCRSPSSRNGGQPVAGTPQQAAAPGPQRVVCKPQVGRSRPPKEPRQTAGRAAGWPPARSRSMARRVPE